MDANGKRVNFCRFCGNELSGVETFCSKCGKKVAPEIDDNVSKTSQINPQYQYGSNNIESDLTPMQRADLQKNLKKLLAYGTGLLLVGVICLIYGISSYIEDKNRYFGLARSVSQNGLLAVFIIAFGIIFTTIGIASFYAYKKGQDKLEK